MSSDITRRRFVGGAAAGAAVAGAATVVPRHVLGGPNHVAPNDKITLAHIGFGTQSIREVKTLLDRPEIQIVTVCDPNTDSNDYLEWGKGGILRTIRQLMDEPSWRANETGCPAGREVGREIVETFYAKNRGTEKYQGCSTYADFREMFDREKDIDAVKIMTPDHLHAVLSTTAMKYGANVMMHKPIANRLDDGRKVLQTQRETGVQTHLLAYGSGVANGQIVERIKQGVIGPLREIHNWTNRPVWPQYTEIPRGAPIPKGFDWDLWLGPATDRPYHPHYTHSVYRGWYDFGGGSMADMGIYSLWPVFVGLDLQAPLSAEAFKTHTCVAEDNTCRRVNNDFAYPTACMQRFHFAAREDMPELDLFWYDGGMKPRFPRELEAQNAPITREGILYVGDDGAILASFHGRDPMLYTTGKGEPLALAPPTDLPREEAWFEAISGSPSPGSFLNAGSITDAVNLGTVALRAEKKVLFDSDAMKITNTPKANQYLTRETRPGWEV